MTIKVIGAGFGRTGTTSLKAALEELGFDPCYHMIEALTHPAHVAVWLAALAGQPPDWRAFFATYQATVDWPACTFYQELLQRYPEAHVVLTVRDPERWYASTRNTIYRLPRSPMMRVLRLCVPHFRRFFRMNEDLIWQGTFGGQFADREHAIRIFQAHNAAVQAHVPAERLLVYDVREGWEPLCRFLGVRVPPGKPFPRLNDTATMQRMMGLGFLGYANLAIATGSEQAVDTLTQRLVADGYPRLDGPRWTGDGYYESVVTDPEGNRIEITV